ncbi:MAG: protein LphB [Legionella sp.]|nr:protein LphB [Legionella sp.]
MKLGLRWYDSVFIVLLIYLFALQIHAIWPFTIDDMYISLRYAKNWASGNGLLWNVHAPPVEGYSNFSFVVLGTLVLLLKGDPVIALKMAGVFGLFFTCIFLYLITRFWFGKRESLLPVFALLFYKGQIIWAVSGLETSVYQALVCASVYFCFRAMGYHLLPQERKTSEHRFFIIAGLLLSLAGMTRPEAPVLMLLFFILICWDRPKVALRNYWYGVLFFSLTIAFAYIPYFLWRVYYFGYLLPNSVYCKGFAKAHTLHLDLTYLKLIWPFVLLALPGCIRSQDKRHYFLWLPSLIYLLILANSDPVVAFDNRLFLPVFPLLLPLAMQGLSVILFWYFQQRDAVFKLSLYFIFLFAVFTIIPPMSLADYRYFSQDPIKGEQLRQKVLDWLKINVSENDSVVLGDSGMIPYYSNLHFIDSYCLNNRTMAHYPAKQRFEWFCQDVMREKPAVIILTSLLESGKVLNMPSDQCLKYLMSKQNKYNLTQSFENKSADSSYRYELFTDHSKRTPLIKPK